MKIAQITPYYFPSIGGVESVTQYISEELINRDNEVHVFTANRTHNSNLPLKRPEIELINGVKVHRLKSFFNIGHMSFFPGLIYPLKKGNFDLIHMHVFRHPHTEIASLLGKIYSIPVILHGHSPFVSRGSITWKKALLLSIYDLQARIGILARIDRIVALTEYEKMQYIRLGTNSQKISIVPNMASTESFKTVDITAFNLKYGLSGKRIMLFLGSLNKDKRADLLIKALPKLVREVPNVFLLLAGPDEGTYPILEKIAEKLKLKDHYKWIGSLYGVEKEQAISASEFLLLPSDEEAFGLVLLEAMAHGKPVIGSDSVGPSEIISHGETGFIVSRGCVDDIAYYSLKLLNNPSLAQHMGVKAKKVAMEKYCVFKVVDQIEKIYKDLIKKR